MKTEFMGIPLDLSLKKELKNRFKNQFYAKNALFIITPGPEFAVRAWKEPLFMSILVQSDLSLCDGFGFRLLGAKIKERITGFDAIATLFETAEEKNKKIFILGSTEKILKKTIANLKQKYPGVKVGGEAKIVLKEKKNKIKLSETHESKISNEGVIKEINAFAPDIILVAFGSPKQEKWIYQNIQKLHSVKIAVGVGGVIDVLGNKMARAPHLLRKTGFEWLWRLATEPKRFIRIFTAVVIFPFYFLYFKIHIRKPVKNSVLAVVLNREGEILIINNRFYKKMWGEDHWEFVQGGIEKNETASKAILRELKEETGSEKFKIIEPSKINYTFILPFNNKYGKCSIKIFYVFCQDSRSLKVTDESEEFKWVKFLDIKEALHPIRRLVLKEIYEELNEIVNNVKIKP